MEKALGLIETIGKLAAIEAMDTAAKAASVELVGLENSRGNGRQTVKIMGEVSAVQAAVDAAVQAVSNLGDLVYAHKVIARPSEELEKMLAETLGDVTANSWYKKDKPAKEEAVTEEPVKEESPQVKKASSAQEKPAAAVVGRATCNLCNDPLCGRTPGELKKKCIHYSENSEDKKGGKR